MALSDHALTTYATVRDELGLSGVEGQDRIERLINAVSEAFESAAGGRHFEYTEDAVDYMRAHGNLRLLMPRAPIVAVTSIEVVDIDGSVTWTYSSDDYAIENAEAGVLYNPSGWANGMRPGPGIRSPGLPGTERASIKVTYDAGYVTPEQESLPGTPRTLPYDIEEAIIGSAIKMYSGDAARRGIISQSTGEQNTSWEFSAAKSMLSQFAIGVAKSYILVGG